MGKKIAEGFGSFFGWVIGLICLWGMWWLTSLIVNWVYLYEWVNWVVVILLWISLYAWWYNSYKKKDLRNKGAIIWSVLEDIRDQYPEIDEELTQNGLPR